MNLKILLLVTVLMILLVVNVSSTELIFVENYCIFGGDCTLNDLELTGNLTFIGSIINITIINQNVTGQFTMGGTVNIDGNLTTDNLIVDGTMLILNTSGRALMNATSTYVSFPGIAGTGNEVIGAGAGAALLATSSKSTLVGNIAGAGLNNANNDENTCIGYDSCTGATSGTAITSIGSGAGVTAAPIYYPVSVGYRALAHATYGVAVGSSAETADGVSIGYQAGDAQGSADVDNILIGYQAGTAITGTGTDNTCVGDLACDTLTSGDGNVFIGADTDGTTTTTNSIAIGFGATCIYDNAAAFGTGASCTGDKMIALGDPTNELIMAYGYLNVTDNLNVNETLYVIGDNVGIGTSSPSANLVILGDVKSGNIANYTEIEDDGTIHFIGNATVWDDLVMPFTLARVPAANAPNWESFIGNLNVYTFATSDYLKGTTELMHNWKENSTISWHVHWATNGADVADKNVSWEIEYTYADMDALDSVGNVFDTPVVESLDTTIPANTPDLTHMYTTVEITNLSSTEIGAQILWRVRRLDATGDDPTANPFAFSVGIHYEQDTIGSRTIVAK